MNEQHPAVETEPIRSYNSYERDVPVPKERSPPSAPKPSATDSSWTNKTYAPPKSANPVRELESLGRVRTPGVSYPQQFNQ